MNITPEFREYCSSCRHSHKESFGISDQFYCFYNQEKPDRIKTPPDENIMWVHRYKQKYINWKPEQTCPLYLEYTLGIQI